MSRLREDTQKTKETAYNEAKLQFGNSITEQEIKRILMLLTEIPRGIRDQIRTGLELLDHLEAHGCISVNNVLPLIKALQKTDLNGLARPLMSYEQDLKNDGQEGQTTTLEPDHGSQGSSEVYKIDSTPKGTVLIITNDTFTNLLYREGAFKDEQDLENIFVSLGYQVKKEKNLTKEAMEEVFYSYARRNDLGDCFIAFISSHGNESGPFGIDVIGTQDENGSQKGLNMVTIRDQMDQNQYLEGKPKAFFIQACRGEQYNTGNVNDNVADAGRALGADIVIGYPTLEGHVAFRNKNTGAWYFQTLIETIKKKAKTEHLLDMLTMVNSEMKEKCTVRGGEEIFQMSSFFSTLTKKFYLTQQ